MQEILSLFRNAFKDEEYFRFADIVDNKIVAYVDKLNLDILHKIPEVYNGVRVLVHYAGSKNICENIYTKYVDLEIPTIRKRLVQLVSIYGKKNVVLGFYEYEDKENVFVSVLDKYPHLEVEIHFLRDRYEFERLINELENLSITY
ncbi:MAG: hypothetical protein LC122_12435 [Chitinophagales bacterium]|nr:hypothetical protein [Chitinophagales bacterium]